MNTINVPQPLERQSKSAPKRISDEHGKEEGKLSRRNSAKKRDFRMGSKEYREISFERI